MPSVLIKPAPKRRRQLLDTPTTAAKSPKSPPKAEKEQPARMGPAPDFTRMAARRPFVSQPAYKEQDSEDEERRRVEEYIGNYYRPPSSMKKSRRP